MKLLFPYLLLSCSLSYCSGQKNFGTGKLKLIKQIAIGVTGRIDHMAVNLGQQILYVAALGNNSVEAIDLQKGTLLHSISGLNEPQGIAYIAEQNEIVVANGGNGRCISYNATDFSVVTSLDLGSDADNVRYDAFNRKVYVGYGNGGIAVIDVSRHQRIADIKLPAHPESFQVDQKNNLLYVNVPGAHAITVIDLVRMKVINTWKRKDLTGNFPMTLDTANNQVIVGYRDPAVVVTYDKDGKEVGRTDLVSDVDDVFYDKLKQQLLASGGGGAINIFRKESFNSYEKIANISTRSGARTSLFIPSLQMFILAERATDGKPAVISVYQTE